MVCRSKGGWRMEDGLEFGDKHQIGSYSLHSYHTFGPLNTLKATSSYFKTKISPTNHTKKLKLA